MPENRLPQPRNILEAINQNVYSVGQDLHKLMDEFYAMRKEIAEMRMMFNPPASEQPNALGGDGAVE